MSKWRSVYFLGAALCVLGLLTACSKRSAAPGAEKIIRISQLNEPATLDPQLASLPDEFFIIRALSEGLVTPTPGGGVEPAIAADWETSDDGLTWTFHLRPDARWSNGDPVIAQDFIYTIGRALTPALAAPKAPLFFVLKNAEAFYRGHITDFGQVGIAAPDARTLVLTLDHPASLLLSLLASGPWIPVHAATVEKFGNTRDSAWSRPGNYIGNGPFVLTEWSAHQWVTVKKNPHYYAKDQVLLDGIRFVACDNQSTEERTYRAGQIDVTMSIPFSKLANYADTRHAQPLAETRYLALNIHRPPLDDPRVRRALTLAIDRDALVTSVLKGSQKPALSFIPPGLGYSPDRQIEPNYAEARRLLAAAGFPEGRNFPRLEISLWTNSVAMEAIQQMWRRELGIETVLVQREARIHQAALRAGDYTIGFAPAIPDFGDASAIFDELVSHASNNYPHWSQPRYDALVAEAERTIDAGQRNARYQAAEAILLEEMPVIPLYFNTQNFLVAPRVQGWRSDALWTRFYRDVSLQP